jgi:hypothetical protein
MKYFLSVLVVGLTICVAMPAFSEDNKSSFNADHFRIGIGGGVPYGGIGVNAEYKFNTYISASAGLGYYQHEGPGFAVGAMFYPLKNDGTVNPRLSAYFGRVSTYKQSTVSGDNYRPTYGGALGAGFDWRIYKRLTFGLDLFYLMKDAPNGYRSGISGAAGFDITF